MKTLTTHQHLYMIAWSSIALTFISASTLHFDSFNEKEKAYLGYMNDRSRS